MDQDDDGRTLGSVLPRDRYPRSAAYSVRDVVKAMAGPNVLWSSEALIEIMHLQPGMRVLDLGCGVGLGSIFLARELGVDVWAVDNMTPPTAIWKRVVRAGLEERVHPVAADARSLPFPEHYFDAVISLTAFQYFGTDDTFIRTLSRFMRPGAELGIVVPGLVTELDEMPCDLAPLWRLSFETFHTPDWWRRFWARSGLVEVDRVERLPDGWSDWADWYELCIAEGQADARFFQPEVDMMRADGGRRFDLLRAVAHIGG